VSDAAPHPQGSRIWSENVRLNFWLIGGEAPASGEDTELIVRRFEFFPSTATGVDRDVTDRQ
jgi:hypothetical protein